jgi:hypothetical protein
VRKQPQSERAVIVYTAGSQSEAMVIRGLLESAGIAIPGPLSPDPYPLIDANMSRGAMHGVEVYAFESQADEARQIIENYLRDDQRQKKQQ